MKHVLVLFFKWLQTGPAVDRLRELPGGPSRRRRKVPVHRIKINLKDDHRRFLAKEARWLGVSRAEAFAGCAEDDGSSVGADHDRYLYGDPRD
jgi:hypothetical protein